jgi:DNA-binding GntR family transcriptional regulator
VAKAVATKTRTEDKRGLLAVVDNDISAVDQVIESLKSGIRQGRYVPGQRLIEPDMMREFGVSRGSVREALRCLEADGLVQIEFYRGARIRKMSRHEFIEANEIRAVLEGFAASLAAQRMNATERKRLVEIEQGWERGGKGWTYAEYNEKFHKLIIEASHHKQLPTYVDQVHLLLFDLQFHRIERPAAATRRSTLEHGRVAKAILKGDDRGAERSMRAHIESSVAEILTAPEEFFS